MEETKQGTRGFFELNEGIFLISTNHTEKQQIEDGLNRDIGRILTVEELIRAFTDLTTNNGVRASIILTNETPAEIKQNLEIIKEVLEVAKVPVFEIGIGALVEGAYRFGTILDFINFARSNRRKAKISEVTDTEQRTILEELQLETEVRQEKIDELEQLLTDSKEELKELEGKYNTLHTEVENVYKVQHKEVEQRIEKLESLLEQTKQMYEIEKKKSEQYRNEKDEALNELTDLKFTEETTRSLIMKRQNEIRSLEKKVSHRDNQISKLIREKEQIIRTKVDAEDHVLLNKELDDERTKNTDLTNVIGRMEIATRQINYEKTLLEEEIKFLRDGNYSIEETGRTGKLDTYEFEKTELIYIKVFEQLPYFRLAMKMFFEKISELRGGRVHLMILKQDDGEDATYFEGIPLWSRLRDVPTEDKIFRMFPNPSMFTKALEWDRKVDLLVVVDYIKNNKYYVTSTAKQKIMTVMRRETDLDTYNLKGSPITLEGRSVFDIKYDPRIGGSGLKQNRHKILNRKVDDWVSNIYE